MESQNLRLEGTFKLRSLSSISAAARPRLEHPRSQGALAPGLSASAAVSSVLLYADHLVGLDHWCCLEHPLLPKSDSNYTGWKAMALKNYPLTQG